jgi:hypothetical protein
MTTSEMTLWTIQRKGAWDRALETGTLKADGRRVPQNFREPYRWLRTQMRERIPGYRGEWPVWAYATEKPDLRRRRFNAGEKGVRIQFVIDASSVLLSDMRAWEAVLSGYYLSVNEADERSFSSENDFSSVWRTRDMDPDRVRKIRDSWLRIFDFALLNGEPQWHGTERRIQATLGNLPIAQVVQATPFVSR